MHALRETDAVRPSGQDRMGGRRESGSRVRRCIVTGVQGPTEGMLRFVVSPDGDVVPDLAAALPGRGLWVTADRDTVESAVGKRHFARAARRAVVADAALADRVEALLVARCVELLGLARRGGGAVAGFEKVRAAARAGRVGVALFAADAAADGRGRIERLVDGIPVIDVLTRHELGKAFGRDEAVHGAVMSGRLAHRLQMEAMRLAGMRRRPAERGTI